MVARGSIARNEYDKPRLRDFLIRRRSKFEIKETFLFHRLSWKAKKFEQMDHIFVANNRGKISRDGTNCWKADRGIVYGWKKNAKETHTRRAISLLCHRPPCFRYLATCYVNTSTETRPIDLRRNGLRRGRVAALLTENSFHLATVQQIIDSRADFRLYTVRSIISHVFQSISPSILDLSSSFYD